MRYTEAPEGKSLREFFRYWVCFLSENYSLEIRHSKCPLVKGGWHTVGVTGGFAVHDSEFAETQCEFAAFHCGIPPTRLTPGHLPFTREALVRCLIGALNSNLHLPSHKKSLPNLGRDRDYLTLLAYSVGVMPNLSLNWREK